MNIKLSALLIAAQLIAAAAFSSTHGCGVDDPLVSEHLHAFEAPVVAQSYESDEQIEIVHGRRRLQQSYNDSSSFIDIQTANAQGWTGNLRISIAWEVVSSGDHTGTSGTARECGSVGQNIEVQSSGGSWVSWACSSAAVVSTVANAAGNDRYLAMKRRTEMAMNFWQAAIKLKPVRDSIVIANSVVTSFALTQNTYSNTDLVIIMTARPSPNSPIAGFATCLQRDQRGRCTVGQFNWVPEVLDVAGKDSYDTMESELHTALHEMVHVLGGMSPGYTGSTPFISNTTGAQRDGLATGVFVVEQDPVYQVSGKQRTLITTPRVVNFTRTYFDCPNATGFPLEDVPLGKGSHWEARVAGPELMSYGSGSGQVYISDLTLGFLEDTNQYIVDYSYGGSIIKDAAVDDYKTMSSLSFLSTNDGASGYVPPKPLPPGAVRWGQGAGCAFLNQKPKVAWPAEYTCTKNRFYTCTPDHRMSAVCIVKGDYSAAEQSCGAFDQSSGAACVSASTAGVPSYMQFFDTDAQAAAASGTSSATVSSTGGFNNAMDYVPVPVGYWNCLYGSPKDNSSVTLGGGDTGASLRQFVTSFGSATDMETFGGQARCPQCRCLQSSLLELTKGINPEQPEYGLCYRTNCYRPDYLQIAVKSVLATGDSFWYGCPQEGGKLYIPGFTGQITCPPADEFCAHETISGIRYPEQNRVLEAIFWGGLCALCAGMFFICSCPCLRDRCINCQKGCCGARVFEIAQEKYIDEKTGREVPPPLPKCASRVMLAVNAIVLLAGLALIGGTSYLIYIGSPAQIMPFISMGILSTMLAFIGVRSACKRAEHGPSCYVLTYFFADVVLVALMAWVVIYMFAFASWKAVIEARFDTIVQFMPAKYDTGTRAGNIAMLESKVEDNKYGVAGAFAAVLAILLSTLFASGRMIHARTLLAIFVTFVNNVMLFFGLLMLVVGLYLVAFKSDAVAGVIAIVGLILGSASFFLIISIVGHVGVFKRKKGVLVAYQVLQVLLAGVAAAAVIECFTSTSKVTNYVNGLDDKSLGELASALGIALTADQIQAKVVDNLNQIGLAFAIVLGLQAALFICTCFFVWALKSAHILSTSPPADGLGLPQAADEHIASPSRKQLQQQAQPARSPAQQAAPVQGRQATAPMQQQQQRQAITPQAAIAMGMKPVVPGQAVSLSVSRPVVPIVLADPAAAPRGGNYSNNGGMGGNVQYIHPAQAQQMGQAYAQARPGQPQPRILR